MARLVDIIGVPHDPTLPAAERLRGGSVPPGAQRALDIFAILRPKLYASRPDVVIVGGSDHLNLLFMNNMPPFMIGKAPRMKGPFPDEMKHWALGEYDVPIDGILARRLLKDGYERGVDFAYSDEFIVDHSFTIPLNFLRPEQDLPAVPLWLNFLAPPVPPGHRYYRVGEIIRETIEAMPNDQRVAAIVTGHMTNSIGSPNMLRQVAEGGTAWDKKTWNLIEANDVQALIKQSTWDQLYAHGNGTPGFLGYIFAYGLARGAEPSFAEMVMSTAQPTVAFLEWNEAALNGKVQ